MNDNNKLYKIEDRLFAFGLALLAVSITISITLMTVATGVLILVFLIKIFKKEISSINTGLERPLVIFIVLYALSSLFSARPLKSLKDMIDNYWYILNFFVVVYLFKKDDIQKFLKILAGASVVMGLYSLVQAFTGWPLLGGFSGDILFGIKMGDDIMEKVFSVGGFQIYMGTGVLSHHLTFGGQILMLTFVTYGVLKKKWKALFVLGGLIFSFAYSAWLGFVAGLIFIFTLKKKRIKYALIVGLLFAGLLVTVPGNVEKIKDKLEGRMAIWNVSLKMYKEKPFFGIGSGQYTRIFNSRYIQDYKGPTSGSKCHPHSIYLSMLVGGGALTFIAFIYFIFIFMRKYIRPPAEMKDKKLYYLLWASLIGIGIAGFFQTYLTDAENSVLIWTLTGLIVKLNIINDKKVFKK